jgi:hypothetical protein
LILDFSRLQDKLFCFDYSESAVLLL